MYVLSISKEKLKFSCSHFTIFNRNQMERLHGHNYYLECHLSFSDLNKASGMTIDFQVVKQILSSLCDSLDERVLLAANNPFIRTRSFGKNLRIEVGRKVYSFPKEDICELPIANITTEELARYLCLKFKSKLTDHIFLKKISMGVTETRGQSAFYEMEYKTNPKLPSKIRKRPNLGLTKSPRKEERASQPSPYV